MPDYDFTVSLNITHPTMEVDEVVEALSRNPEPSHNKGDLRIARNGRLLGGCFEEMFCRFDLCGGRNISSEEMLFEEFLKNKNNELAKYKDFFESIISTGGKVEYFVGWFSVDSVNMNIYFEPSLLKDIADLGITLALHAYPD